MKAIWAVAVGLALGIGVAWWLARDTPQQAEANAAEARTYYDIADRMDRAISDTSQPGEEHKP